MRLVILVALLLFSATVRAQQFYSDNQWVAPHGVATLMSVVGEEYTTLLAVAALAPEWEFNLGATRFYDDTAENTDAYTTWTFYLKRRLWQNAEETGGAAIMFGTGISPSHIESGRTTKTLQSWWGNYVYTIPFRGGDVTWDLLPGFNVDFDLEKNDQASDETAWAFTYGSRVAIYKVVPQSAIVAEIFGGTGEGGAPAAYRAGIRWESPKFVVAATYSDTFDGSDGLGFEIGFLYFTDPRFCFGGCR